MSQSTTASGELDNDQWADIEKLYKAIYDFESPIPVIDMPPLINRASILPDPISAITKSGIIIPETARERPSFGTILAVGPGRTSEHGVLIPTQVEVGARVSYGRYSGTWVYDEKLECMLLLVLDSDCLTHKPQPHLVAGTGLPTGDTEFTTDADDTDEENKAEAEEYPPYASGDARI